jgi:membrane fusion protein (multidrug efflux system)
MKRVHIRILVLVALTLGVGWAVFAKTSSSEANQKKGDKGGSGAVLVTTYEINPKTLNDTLTTIGTLEAEESITVRNEVAGKVVAIGFEEGEKVERGQVLVRMRSDVLRAGLQVNKQRQALLQTQLERQQKVLAQGGISQQEVDQTANELAVVGAEEQQIRAQIDQTVVRAPFDGVVGIRQVSPGAILSAASPIAALRKLDHIDVGFTVPERHAPRLRVGQEVRFRVHGSDKIHRAKVRIVEPGLDPDNRSLRVEARAASELDGLRPGAFAQVRILLERIDGALAVPASALVISGDASHVWINDDGKAKKQVVKTGFRTESSVEILDGLSAGDEVIGTGFSSLQPGQSVEADTSDDAMNLDGIAPDPSRTGMRHRWFSEETIEEETFDDNEQQKEEAK